MSNEKPRTRMVEIPLVECAVSIIAAPGDRLLVWQGVCLGVDTSRETSPTRLLPAPSLPAAAPKKPVGRPKGSGGRKGKGKGKAYDERVSYQEFRAALVSLLTERGPMQRREIAAWGKERFGLNTVDHFLFKIVHGRDREVAKIETPGASFAEGRFRYTLRGVKAVA